MQRKLEWDSIYKKRQYLSLFLCRIFFSLTKFWQNALQPSFY